MQGNLRELTIIRYRRKSSEGDERQIASLPDQAVVLDEIIERLGVAPAQIVDDVEEAKSAKEPGRPGFSQRVIASIVQGKANGIVCWHADRLSRNAIDTAALVNLMDIGKLKAIITNQQIFWNTPMDKFMLALLCGQAKLENDNKGVNVRRGLAGKLRKGWRPGVAPIGYLNNKAKEHGERDILVDDDRFPLVRKMWDLLLSGKYSIRQIREIANEQLGLRTRQTKKQGGKRLSISHVYQIFNEPFYYGSYWWKNTETGLRELKKGKHRPIISEQEYDWARKILGCENAPKAKPKSHLFAYTGLFRCGECGSGITAEEKWHTVCGMCGKKFASGNKEKCPFCLTRIDEMQDKIVRHYVYYHCTKKKNPTCTQKGIREEEFDRQVDEVLKRFNIKEKYFRWAVETLKQATRTEEVERQRSESHVKREQTILKEELAEINRFIIKQENTGWTLMKREEAVAERARIESLLDELEGRMASGASIASIDAAILVFDYAHHVRDRLQKGTPEEKKDIVTALGSNLTLKDKILNVPLCYPLAAISQMIEIAPEMAEWFEPPNNEGGETNSHSFEKNIPALLRSLNDVRTFCVPRKIFLN